MEQILSRIKNLVEDKLGDGYEVQSTETVKNNGKVRHGLNIDNDNNSSVCPVMYIDGFVKEIQAGALTEHEAADSVVRDYKAVATQRLPGMTTLLTDKQRILDRVVCHLVNAEMNTARLSKSPHREFLDLFVEYRLIFTDLISEYGSTNISKKMCESLGITEDELDAAAKSNTCKTGFEGKPMFETLAELANCPVSLEDSLPMMVYTNKERTFGATVLLYPDEFKVFAEKIGDDLFILPSSVHEVIAVPAGLMPKDNLRDMVGLINMNEVAAEEVLSTNVYRYSLDTGDIMIA